MEKPIIIITVSKSSSDVVKMYECIKALNKCSGVNLIARGLSIQNLENIIELLEIKRPNLYKYYNLDNFSSKIKNKQLSIIISLNKINQIPEGYKIELNQEEINTINRINNTSNKSKRKYMFEDIPLLTKEQLVGLPLEKRCSEIFNNQKKYKKLTEITILYRGDIFDGKLFGEIFVNNNKKFCKIEYKGKEYELQDTYYFDDLSESIIEIKLKGVNKVTDISFMFYKCYSLLAVPDFSFLKTYNITKMSSVFYKCKSLAILPDLSYLNTSNVTDMSHMFAYCLSLRELPDISYWDISNVKYLRCMLSNCVSLKELPDISYWYIYSCEDMNGIFKGCTQLVNLPDISKWNISNVTDIGNLFCNCFSLMNLPDISKWNIENVTDLSSLFENCFSLRTLPDLSKWNT